MKASTYTESFTSMMMVCMMNYDSAPTHHSCLDTVAPIEREIRSLAAGLMAVKDEQEYIVVRERTHRNTAESTNDRVKWWSVAQVIILFSVVAWQVYYLKVCFLLAYKHATYLCHSRSSK